MRYDGLHGNTCLPQMQPVSVIYAIVAGIGYRVIQRFGAVWYQSVHTLEHIHSFAGSRKDR